MAGWIKKALDMEVGLGTGLVPGHIVLDGEPAPLPQKGDRAPPIFGPFLLSQTAGDSVSDGDPASPPLKGHSPPIFGQCPLWPKDWMD